MTMDLTQFDADFDQVFRAPARSPIAAITIRDAQTIRDSLNRYGTNVTAATLQAAKEVAFGKRKDGCPIHECIRAGRGVIDGAAVAVGGAA